MTRRCPPAILILWQFAHLRTLPRSGRMVAVAIAHRRPGSGNKSWRLICQSRDGNCCQKDSDANAMAGSASKCHDSLWSGKRGRPIARRVRFSGIGVLNVPVPTSRSRHCNYLRVNGLFNCGGMRIASPMCSLRGTKACTKSTNWLEDCPRYPQAPIEDCPRWKHSRDRLRDR